MLYFDNAATSSPKAPGVSERMRYYLDAVCANINRGENTHAIRAGMVTLRLRERLCELFHFDAADHVLLNAGATMALNVALKGFLKPGDHVLVSAYEHNAVMRPLVQLGVDFDRVPGDEDGCMDVSAIEPLIRSNTKLFALAHASNVTGTLQDVEAVGAICKKHNIAFVVDAAQTAGYVPIDFHRAQMSAMAVPAHKGLLGPQGIGALLLREDFAKQLDPLIIGGTGSMSDSEEVPPYMPDRFESGTPNLPGIYGWAAAMEYLASQDENAHRQRQTALLQHFLHALQGIEHLRILGKKTAHGRVGVVSLDFTRFDNAQVCDRLEREFGIITRSGLHCAPAAHKAMGTFPRGTVRFALGYSTTFEEIDAALQAITAIAAQG
ncbi:MAG: aminotransferase class V-fold PLP-dependent enzyme [Oscillospiraceae bacterium]|jgi:cysteine desulfurase family protein|nr:aminotransferase class V-fold PLP-dependent enzyme [Oscillospiraceae bacterium]